MQREVATLLQRGATKDEIVAYMRSQGVQPSSGLDDALKARASGYNGAYSVTPEKGDKEANVRGALGASKAGAFFSGAFNGMTAGMSDEIAGGIDYLNGGDYTQGRDSYNAKKKLLAEAQWEADLLGNVMGGSLGILAPEFALGKLGLGATSAATFAPRALALDAAYGGAYGAGENNQNRLSGGMFGAVSGAAGGALGRGAMNGLGAAIAPTGGAFKPLYSEGVFPTLGQRMGDKGVLGRAINIGEQALQSVPGVGSLVSRARQLPRDQFERGAFNQALSEIGEKLPPKMEMGTEPHSFMQNAFNEAYDKTRGQMRFLPDQQYGADHSAFRHDLFGGILSKDQAERVETIIDRTITGRLGTGGMTGDTYKAASSELGKNARKLSASEPGMADALNSYQTIFDDAARRASGPEAAAALDAVDRGYAKAVRVEEAAAARGGDTGRFSPTQFDRAVQKTSGGVRSRAYLRGDALMSDYAASGKGLVDTLGNSGSAERLLTAGGSTAAAGWALGIPTVLKAAPLFAPYVPGLNHAATRALAPRNSPALNAIGNGVKKTAWYGGMFAAPLLSQRGQ